MTPSENTGKAKRALGRQMAQDALDAFAKERGERLVLGISPTDPRLVIGAQVIYQQAHMTRGEPGLVSSLQSLPRYIHVRFGVNATGAACNPRDLEFTYNEPTKS